MKLLSAGPYHRKIVQSHWKAWIQWICEWYMQRIENVDEINAFKSLTASLEYRYIHSSSVNDIMNLYVISGYTKLIFKVVCPFSQTRKPVTINISLVNTLIKRLHCHLQVWKIRPLYWRQRAAIWNNETFIYVIFLNNECLIYDIKANLDKLIC